MSKTAIAGTGERLLLLGAGVALSYLAAFAVDGPVPIEAAWKAAGILLFAAYAFSRGAKIAGAALIFSAAGDAALALEPPSFVAGMALFGIAHILYLAAFAARIGRDGFNRARPAFAAFILAASIAMLFWFLPDMGALKVPGLLYQAIITAMVVAAVISRAPILARAGAVVFMGSDALIALGLYKEMAVVPGSVWVLYAAAQFMLAKGLSTRNEA